MLQEGCVFESMVLSDCSPMCLDLAGLSSTIRIRNGLKVMRNGSRCERALCQGTVDMFVGYPEWEGMTRRRRSGIGGI